MDGVWEVAVGVLFLGGLTAVPASVFVCDRIRGRARERARQPRAGGIYSIGNNAEYKIVKVLVVDPGAVHERIYAGTMSTRPTSVNPGDLRLGGDEPAGRSGVTNSVRFGRDEIRPETTLAWVASPRTAA
jgi:hypothetical protein